jgi:hypothetical protein
MSTATKLAISTVQAPLALFLVDWSDGWGGEYITMMFYIPGGVFNPLVVRGSLLVLTATTAQWKLPSGNELYCCNMFKYLFPSPSKITSLTGSSPLPSLTDADVHDRLHITTTPSCVTIHYSSSNIKIMKTNFRGGPYILIRRRKFDV